MLVFKLCSSWLIELEEDEFEELEPMLSLACWRVLAPGEFGEIAASSESALPTAELSPASIACMIVWISTALSFGLAAVELVVLEGLLDPPLAAEAALRAVESSASISCCAEVRSPFCKSEPS